MSNMPPQKNKRKRTPSPPPRVDPKDKEEKRESDSWDFTNPKECAERISQDLTREGWNEALFNPSPPPLLFEPMEIPDLFESMMRPYELPYNPKRWNHMLDRICAKLDEEAADFVSMFKVQ